ncbi:MAG: GNAT family N-acetyltransferase, partial [Bacteroidota bacterium]
DTKQRELDVWAILTRHDNQFIGTCAAVYNFRGGTELGYRLDDPYWGKGYASETTKGLIDYSFAHMDSDLLIARADKQNIASCRILKKFMRFQNEEFNEEDQCMDLVFHLRREDWVKR